MSGRSRTERAQSAAELLALAAAIAAAGRRRRELVVALVAAAGPGCARSPEVGPSPVAVAPPPGTVSAPATTTPRPIPAWIDSDLVGTLVVVDGAGAVRHWAGGPFHHCLAPEVDRAVVEPIIAEMTALSGIPQTEAGPCNVQWIADYERHDHTYAELTGTEAAIVSARVFLYQGGGSTARHEAGHVLGFGHSTRREDLMNATPRVDTFSRDELAVLAWIYGQGH